MPAVAVGRDILVTTGFALVWVATRRYFVRLGPLGKAWALVESVTIAAVLLVRDLLVNPRRLLPVLSYAAGAVAVAVDYLRIGSRLARQGDQQSAQ